MVPHADYQSICVTWLPGISFPFSFICLAATIYMPKLKIEAMTSWGAIFQGQNRPLLLYDCKESCVCVGGGRGGGGE